MNLRILTAMLLAAALTAPLGATSAGAQTATKPAATPAPATATTTKPATPAKATKEDDEDEPSSAEQKKACDGKWKAHRDKSGEKGYKAYFTFMAKCM